MKTFIRPFPVSDRKTTAGLYPIYMRITQAGDYSLFSTEIYIEKKHWNPKGNYTLQNWIIKHPSAKAWNNKIYLIWNQIQTIVDQNPGIHRTEIVKKLNEGVRTVTLTQFGGEFIDQLLEDGKLNPYKQTKTALEKFRRFAGDIALKAVTPQQLNDFQRYLANDLGNHPNTIASNITKLKGVFKEAHRQKLVKYNPFDSSDYHQTKTVRTKKEALSIEQIKAIAGLPLKPDSDLWHVRNYFMFSFWNAGIRFSDLAHLKWDNIKDGRLVYEMGKTGRQKNIELTQPARDILEYYRKPDSSKDDFIFPLLPSQNLTETGFKRKANSKNVVVNQDLKKIQEMAGIDTNISFHISRHSFARYAKSRGLSLEAIGKLLGHSKRDVTEQYLDDLSEYDADSELAGLAKGF